MPKKDVEIGMEPDRSKGIIPSKGFLAFVGASIGLATYAILVCSVSSVSFKDGVSARRMAIAYFLAWPGLIMDFLHLPITAYPAVWFVLGPLLYVAVWCGLTIRLVPMILRRMKK